MIVLGLTMRTLDVLCVRDSGAINKTSAVMNGGGGAYAGDGGAS